MVARGRKSGCLMAMARYIGAMNQFCSVYLVYVELMTAAVLEHVGSLALADAQSFKFNGGGDQL